MGAGPPQSLGGPSKVASRHFSTISRN
jgi:hypothetical protein